MTFRDVLGEGPAEGVPWHSHDGADISGEIVASTIRVLRLLGGTITAEESIIAGGVLGILRSDNFVAGSAGWRALGDGTFEAQDGIFRGTLNADDINAGTLDVDRLGAESITVAKLFVGSFDNLVQDPHFSAVSTAWIVDVSGGGTWTFGVSGGFGNELTFAPPSTSDARVHANDIACSVGDIFYFEVAIWLDGSTAGTARIKLAEELGDHTFNSVLSQTTQSLAGSGFITMSVSRTISEDDTEFIRPEIQVDSGATISSHVAFTRAYVRRKAGTSIIEDLAVTNAKIGALAVDTAEIAVAAITKLKIGDQEVDIQRMLNPIFNDRQGDTATNISLSTTEVDTGSITVTVPSWVGTLNMQSVHTCQVTAGATQLIQIETDHGAAAGSATQMGITSAAPSTYSQALGSGRAITSPGSSITVDGRCVLDTGTNSSNAFVLTVFSSGLR